MVSNSSNRGNDSTDANLRVDRAVTTQAEEALARFVLGLATRETVYEAFVSRAEETNNANALVALGRLDRRADEWQRSVAEQLGLRVPTQRQSAQFLAILLSRRILSGELDPFVGARELGEVSRAVEGEKFHELDTFIYAESEAEDRPHDSALFRESILNEARRWAALVDRSDA